MNPLLGQNPAKTDMSLSQSEEAIVNQVKSIKSKIYGLRSLSSPQDALNYLMQSNPNIQKAAQFIMQCGNDPVAAIDQLARQKGINPQVIFNALK